ncbi:MAG: adenosylhomocysteinase [Oscillospiraceae bacterium]|nr:adenosylhomocysteinase [Oscillospiraceae bacterium]
MNILRDEGLAGQGRQKIEWARAYMPALARLREVFLREKPLEGTVIATSVHLEAKTANLALLLKDAGAEVFATGCNPLSTQDDVAAGLASYGVAVTATHGCDPAEYTRQLSAALSCSPHLVLDDGGDFAELLHGQCSEYAARVVGATEETTTGVSRLRARMAAGALRYPVYAVNDADMKHLFDNRYGTGESVWAAIMATSNVLLAGKTAVVAGYGWCGRGVAMRAAGLGMKVIVTEIDAVKAIEAVMDGHTVMTMDEAAACGDFFVTVTGVRDVIAPRHFHKMKDGAILANAGHFDVEIDVAALRSGSTRCFEQRANILGFEQPDGRVLNLIAEGRLCNIAAGNGHPAEIMDMSFAVQALALTDMLKVGPSLNPGVYNVPREIDIKVSAYKLAALGVGIDKLTEAQEAYRHHF